MDRVSKAVRSKIMAAIRSRENKTTEIALGKLFSAVGLRGYRKHWSVDGRPDFAWPRLKVAVFVDGCFWHGCPHCHKPPKSNLRYWRPKLDQNRRRDKRISRRLRRAGWSVFRVWECQIGRMFLVVRIARAVAVRRRATKPTASRQTQRLARAAAV